MIIILSPEQMFVPVNALIYKSKAFEQLSLSCILQSHISMDPIQLHLAKPIINSSLHAFFI
jgi:hypothetical protein